MARSSGKIDVYLEVGKKRIFAAAVEWPGWSRSGKNEAEALESLLAYGTRYARAVRTARLGFTSPQDVSAFRITERVAGNATTDFGTPGVPPSADERPLREAELARLKKIWRACWREFEAVSEAAHGKALRKGPRGGGRDLDKIVEHVLGGEQSYLTALGGKVELGKGAGLEEQMEPTREAVLETLEQSRQGKIAPFGPRGGRRWTARYFIRRSAWHLLDHAWEIEDRIE